MENKQSYEAPTCDIAVFEGTDVLTASIIMPPHIIGGSNSTSGESDKI